jgi:putative intracellular protease/amidase
LLEDESKKLGVIYSKKEDQTSYVVEDSLLISGQNPASSDEVAKQLLSRLK